MFTDLTARDWEVYEVEGNLLGVWVNSLPSPGALSWPELVNKITMHPQVDGILVNIPDEAPWKGMDPYALPVYGGNGGPVWVSLWKYEPVECRDCRNSGMPHSDGRFYCWQHMPEEELPKVEETRTPQVGEEVFYFIYKEGLPSGVVMGKLTHIQTEGAITPLGFVTSLQVVYSTMEFSLPKTGVSAEPMQILYSREEAEKLCKEYFGITLEMHFLHKMFGLTLSQAVLAKQLYLYKCDSDSWGIQGTVLALREIGEKEVIVPTESVKKELKNFRLVLKVDVAAIHELKLELLGQIGCDPTVDWFNKIIFDTEDVLR